MVSNRKKSKHTSIDTDEVTVVDTSKSEHLKRKVKLNLNIMLTIIQGSEVDFGKTYNLSQNSIRIGRNPKLNSITLNDRKISKVHCEISTIKTNSLEQIVIKDMGSTNGTYVNGELIQQCILTSGDKITVGETVIRFNFNDRIEEEYHAKLFNFAAVDALTGLYNRRYILNELENQLKIVKRNKREFSIIMFDIDDFKRINDTYGHHAGDEYLKKIAFIINHSLREQDIPGRVGGEEFLIILPETSIEGADQLANRIREKVEQTGLAYKSNTIKSTISAGISRFEPGTDSQTLYQLADSALYRAKQAGKNKVIKLSLPIHSDKSSPSPSGQKPNTGKGSEAKE